MSASQTMPQPSRQWDYLYDTTYTVSGHRDHQRHEMKAYTKVDRIRKNINFKTMFSSLTHYPSYKVTLQKTDPIPPFIDRAWRNFPEANHSAKAKIAPQVSGRNRYKYFRRPNIPALSSVAYQEISGQEALDPNVSMGNQANVVNVGALGQPDNVQTAVLADSKKASEFHQGGLMKTQQTQTDYRESEAQTDPYSPEWVLSEGQNINEAPEIVTLMSLTYGAGLPAGPIEIEMIERARARRKWEESLPPLNGSSPAALDKRRKMMAEQEKKQWQWREQNLERMHKVRLELLAQALNDRNEMKEEQTEERLQILKQSQEKDTRVALEKYRNEHIKAIRKLIKSSHKKMANVPDPNKHNHGKRDIVADYANCGSSSWAPLSRDGVFPDRRAEQNNIVNNENTTRYLNTLSGLVELENSLSKNVTEVSVQTPVPPTEYKSGFVPRAMREQHELDEVYHMLKQQEIEQRESKGKKGINPDDLKLLKKIEKPQPRPMTPTKTFDEELGVWGLKN